MLCPEAGVADWAEIVFKYPIRDTEALSSGGGVRVAVVDTNVHTSIDDLLLRLRKAGEGASLLQGVRVSRGHLKIQLVGTEEKSQHMRNRAAGGGVTRGILGKIGRVDESLPLRIGPTMIVPYGSRISLSIRYLIAFVRIHASGTCYAGSRCCRDVSQNWTATTILLTEDLGDRPMVAARQTRRATKVRAL